MSDESTAFRGVPIKWVEKLDDAESIDFSMVTFGPPPCSECLSFDGHDIACSKYTFRKAVIRHYGFSEPLTDEQSKVVDQYIAMAERDQPRLIELLDKAFWSRGT